MEVWRGGGSWDLVKPYVVCLPQADTKVIVVDSDSYWRLITIVVAEGASKGCRGQVEFHDLEYRVTKTGERVRTPVPSYVGSNEVQPTPSKKKKGQ
jgi:hypothetical protein